MSLYHGCGGLVNRNRGAPETGVGMKGLPVEESRYYHGSEADMFSFIRLPKILFTDERYKKLTVDSKVIYSAMLDRMSLSVQEGWYDDRNRVYIYFTLDTVCAYLNCSKGKGCKVLSELESEGMISRKKQGLSRPDMIYVLRIEYMPSVTADYKNTTVVLSGFEPENTQGSSNENKGLAISGTPEFQISQPKSSKERNLDVADSATTKFRKREFTELHKPEPNYTEKNYTDDNDTDFINQSSPSVSVELSGLIERVMDGRERADESRFMSLLDDACGLSFWSAYYERKEKQLEELLDDGSLSLHEFEKQYVDPGCVFAMAKCLVKLFIGDPRTPVTIKTERIDRKTALLHLCRHSGKQFCEAYSIARRSTRSSNVSAYAVSTLYSMEET